MPKKKTHEEFVEQLNKVHGKGTYTPLEEYKGTNTKIKVKHNCKKCNYHEWGIIPSNILQAKGCPVCGRGKQKTTEEFKKEIYNKYGSEYEVLGEYINNHTKIKVRHKCGYRYGVRPNNLLNGNGCPVCSGKTAKLGINTMWDTDRWMVDLGVSEEDAKKYSSKSHKKITVKCPDCERKKTILINQIYNSKSIGCSCGDGKSYPEKFMFNLLEQLGLEFETEYKPKWIDNKRYDFYIKKYDCIIETHGLQHYEYGFKVIGGRELQEEQQNDKFKKETALANGIKHYIELDCRESNLEWIKNSILKSELANLYDLSNINWTSCAEFSNKNIVKEMCEYWNNKRSNETTGDLAKVFKLSITTIRNYLKKGNKLGWCMYDGKEERFISGGKQVKIFKNEKSLGIFKSCSELERQSEKLFGVKLLHSAVSRVCSNKTSQYKGFTFKYVD